jgi:hypothetical protein
VSIVSIISKLSKLTIYSIQMNGSAIKVSCNQNEAVSSITSIVSIVVNLNLSKSAIYSIELCTFGPTHVDKNAGGCSEYHMILSNLVTDMGKLESTHCDMASLVV